MGKQIIELLPSHTNLYSVNYREDLSGKINCLQECISENCLDKLYEELSDYLYECQQEGLQCYKEELKEDIMSKFNLDDEESHCLVYETCQDEIDEILYQRDNSDAVADLLKNTGKFSLFIDTGLEIEEGSWNWTRSVQTLWLKKIKRKLKIESREWDSKIRIMLSQASYGGQLVVYFYDSIDEMITNNPEKDWKSIRFTNPSIAIINTSCGSGDHASLTGHSFTIPFCRKNLFIDWYFKYDFVATVCGMPQDWCKESIANFSFKPIKGRKNALSPLVAEAIQDKEYALRYNQGKCTFGDMDMSRHRDTYYINDFPCGTKCPHCGSFWID